ARGMRLIARALRDMVGIYDLSFMTCDCGAVTSVVINPKSTNKNDLCLWLFLGSLGAVLAARFTPLFDAAGIQCAAHDVIAHAGQIFDAPAANQHDGVLLQRMSFTRNVRRDLDPIC